MIAANRNGPRKVDIAPAGDDNAGRHAANVDVAADRALVGLELASRLQRKVEKRKARREPFP